MNNLSAQIFNETSLHKQDYQDPNIDHISKNDFRAPLEILFFQ